VKRSVILILVMTLLGTGVGLWMESSLRETCQWYIERAMGLRQLVEAGSLQEALQEQTYLYARWQGEAQKLNAMVSHHHTRAVDEAMMRLATALKMGWQIEALLSLDALQFSLVDLETDMTLRWENVM